MDSGEAELLLPPLLRRLLPRRIVFRMLVPVHVYAFDSVVAAGREGMERRERERVVGWLGVKGGLWYAESDLSERGELRE